MSVARPATLCGYAPHAPRHPSTHQTKTTRKPSKTKHAAPLTSSRGGRARGAVASACVCGGGESAGRVVVVWAGLCVWIVLVCGVCVVCGRVLWPVWIRDLARGTRAVCFLHADVPDAHARAYSLHLLYPVLSTQAGMHTSTKHTCLLLVPLSLSHVCRTPMALALTLNPRMGAKWRSMAAHVTASISSSPYASEV